VLGDVRLPALEEGLPAEVVEEVLAAERAEESLPPDVAARVAEREAARRARDWARRTRFGKNWPARATLWRTPPRARACGGRPEQPPSPLLSDEVTVTWEVTVTFFYS